MSLHQRESTESLRNTGKFIPPTHAKEVRKPTYETHVVAEPSLWTVEGNEEYLKETSLNDQRKYPTAPVFFVALLLGAWFGFVSYRGGVALPSVVINQLLFYDFTVSKFLLSALGGSMLVNCFLSLPFATREYFRLSRAHNRSSHGALVAFIGGCILGLGTAMCGACPGQAVNQIGLGFYWAFFTVAGGLVGAYIYGLLYQPLKRSSLWSMLKAAPETDTLDKWLQLPFWVTSLACMAVVGSALYITEMMYPYVEVSNAPWLVRKRWAPHIAGFALGLLQLPSILILKRTLESSHSYAVVASHISNFISPSATQANDYFKDKLIGRGNWIQPTYLLGALFGALVSSILAGYNHWFHPTLDIGTGPGMSFLGGLFLIFGTLLAGGCPSGHGISGSSQLFFNSVAAIIGMALGGIMTASFLEDMEAYSSTTWNF